MRQTTQQSNPARSLAPQSAKDRNFGWAAASPAGAGSRQSVVIPAGILVAGIVAAIVDVGWVKVRPVKSVRRSGRLPSRLKVPDFAPAAHGSGRRIATPGDPALSRRKPGARQGPPRFAGVRPSRENQSASCNSCIANLLQPVFACPRLTCEKKSLASTTIGSHHLYDGMC